MTLRGGEQESDASRLKCSPKPRLSPTHPIDHAPKTTLLKPPTSSPQPKLRLDAYLSARLPDASRAKIQASIKGGLVAVNGAAAVKPSAPVRVGDVVSCRLLAPEPCTVRATCAGEEGAFAL